MWTKVWESKTTNPKTPIEVSIDPDFPGRVRFVVTGWSGRTRNECDTVVFTLSEGELAEIVAKTKEANS